MADAAKLNTGASIPLLGLGTGSDGSLSHEERKAAISAAIEVGYRDFDTASIYESEGFIGEALQDAITAGSVKREDLFITSKLWCSDVYPEGVLPALQKSLRELKLDYLDLYLIHWPIRCKEGAGTEPKADELLPVDVKGTWRAMEECAKQGLTRAIGVSNFSSKKVMDVLEFAAVNQVEIHPKCVCVCVCVCEGQVEIHPKWQQKQLREACNKANIHISAWSPLGAPTMYWGSPGILDDPIIKEIALKHDKTPAQIVLRWALDHGVSALPKSFNKKRMTENFEVFGWRLTDNDHHYIGKIKQKKNIDGSSFCNPVSGPYKSLAELWDGEM